MAVQHPDPPIADRLAAVRAALAEGRAVVACIGCRGWSPNGGDCAEAHHHPFFQCTSWRDVTGRFGLLPREER